MRLAKRRRVRPSDPMAVVTRFLEAANRHDADTLYATVHPEFESFQPLHPARNFRGPGQLISNWKAIFEAEPGFRLTVLRASTTGNTVWVEVHGAGDTAEAAGIFIVGVENSRIRWVRVYSDLVEPAPEKAEDDPPAPTVAVAEPATPYPAASEPEPDAATPRPEPAVRDTVPAAGGSAASDLQSASDAVIPPDTGSTPGNEGLWAAAENDSEPPASTTPSADTSPWLVETGGVSPDGANDDSPAPPEPGLRLVAPAPPPDAGTGLGTTVDETALETLVGPATAPARPTEPGATTAPEPAATGHDGAVTDGAVTDYGEPRRSGEPVPAGPSSDDGDAPGTSGDADPAAPTSQTVEAASADEGLPGPERPPTDEPDRPPWSRLRKALGKD